MDHAHQEHTAHGDHRAPAGQGAHPGPHGGGHPHEHRHGPHEGHPGPGGGRGHGHGPASWSMAARATLHCLTGCAVGEILGMVIGTALAWGNAPTMALAIVLAFVFGYSFTLFSVRRAGLGLRRAVRIALAADTVSIAVMELVDNGIIALVPDAMDAHLSDTLFWTSLLGGLVIAFVLTTPVNKWMIGRGKGHAVVHAHH
ncbi:DUF4396 domain-containing protein [Streptomyces sp. SHP 1-2]|uniref:DUF4396 domain-containing protein n=1 Tax=Streptomyces sp. SHP 1-2 TaxID=2769489 RepID=UPI002237AB0F|nr:DUF4396 domain-containing protein [Streptomyces sp. SHP 1-2]MCW5253024.1 DUF4396 domain-containing protein [Streptomyces sp. SHP 1-2]